LLANHGFDPSEADPRFHQQMVYAIASRTMQMFEVEQTCPSPPRITPEYQHVG
jgi:hypothetical protein